MKRYVRVVLSKRTLWSRRHWKVFCEHAPFAIWTETNYEEAARLADLHARTCPFVRTCMELDSHRTELDWYRKQFAVITEALERHPSCDVYDDDDPITCGWKSVVKDIRWALTYTQGETHDQEAGIGEEPGDELWD